MTDEKLWTVFSVYTRLRDSDADGFGRCFTCGRIVFWREGDAGHGLGRQHMATKYEEKNVHLQCKPCNGFHGGKRELYKFRVNKLYGPQTWDLLEIKSKSVSKWSQFEVDQLTNHYMEEIDKLLQKKNFKLKFQNNKYILLS